MNHNVNHCGKQEGGRRRRRRTPFFLSSSEVVWGKKAAIDHISNWSVMKTQGGGKPGEWGRKQDRWIISFIITSKPLATQRSPGGAHKDFVSAHHRTGRCIEWSPASPVPSSTVQSRSRSPWVTDAVKSAEVRRETSTYAAMWLHHPS